LENIYKLSIRLLSDNYNFYNDTEILKQYNIKILIKGESIFENNPDSSFKAKKNVLIIDNIYNEQISNISIDNLDEINKIINILDQKYQKILNIKYEFYISCSINNDQFGFEIDNKLLSILSKYNYSIIISGVALL
jgi:hypothetical protein